LKVLSGNSIDYYEGGILSEALADAYALHHYLGVGVPGTTPYDTREATKQSYVGDYAFGPGSSQPVRALADARIAVNVNESGWDNEYLTSRRIAKTFLNYQAYLRRTFTSPFRDPYTFTFFGSILSSVDSIADSFSWRSAVGYSFLHSFLLELYNTIYVAERSLLIFPDGTVYSPTSGRMPPGALEKYRELVVKPLGLQDMIGQIYGSRALYSPVYIGTDPYLFQVAMEESQNIYLPRDT
jgi:hypothetical protein